MEEQVKNYLQQHGITYTEHTHPAVFTVKESSIHCAHIPGLHCKNLFLQDRDTGQHYLVTLPAHTRLDIKALQKSLHVKKLTFGKEQDLQELLGLTPGSVSPLGLINDTNNKVIAIITKEVWDAPIVGFHPNINTSTLEVNKESFHKLMNSFHHHVLIIDL
ncbi:prolyl-tRNA synthetase associated domain-containing protein [Candidatus Woesearchaeota archaeon]|nr:prolyl-tRNA synthetase associated domain-containing protein [Candidatus Woesearchaeota archaeon]